MQGAINAYLRASDDPVRVNGSEVRAKVVGEGANLGVTQLGRVEFAQALSFGFEHVEQVDHLGAAVLELVLDLFGDLSILLVGGGKAAEVDLSPWAGRRVQLDLVTEDLGDPTNDVGAWSEAAVVRQPAARAT